MSTTTLAAQQRVDQFLASLPGIGGRWFKTDDDRLALDLPANALTEMIEGILAENELLNESMRAVADRQVDGAADATLTFFLLASGLSVCTVNVDEIAVQAEAYELKRVLLEDGRVQFSLEARQ